MNKKEIFEFLNTHGVAALATIDGEKPCVRYVWTVKSDEDGILFHTGKHKDLYTQLTANPNVEMCFVNEDKSVQIRVAGTARLLEDPALKQELAEQRPFLKAIARNTGGSLDFLSIFLLEKGTATIWTMESNMNPEPKTYIELT